MSAGTATGAPAMLFAEEVAERAGVNARTITYYLSVARRKRAEGTARPFDLPEPAGYVRREYRRRDGRSLTAEAPRWAEADITDWLAARPGPGTWAREGEEPEPKVRLTLRLDEPLHDRAVRNAEAEEMTLTRAIRTAISGWCDEREAVREAVAELRAKGQVT